MPYKNIGELPSSVKSIPNHAKKIFLKAFNSAYKTGRGDTFAMKVGWAAVKKKYKKVNGSWVSKTSQIKDVEFVAYVLDEAETFITKTEEGEVLKNYVLSDVFPDNKGDVMTEDLLKSYAEEINNNNYEIDTDHEMFEGMKKIHGGDVNKVSSAMKFKKGIAKIYKAFVDKGKLILSVLFDKRYKNYENKIKGMSIEAANYRDPKTKVFTKGKFLGATFAVNQTPVNRRAVAL